MLIVNKKCGKVGEEASAVLGAGNCT